MLYTHTHTHTHTHIHTHKHICVHMLHTHTHTHSCSGDVIQHQNSAILGETCTCVQTDTCIYACIYVYICIYMYIYICIYIYTHTHTHIRTYTCIYMHKYMQPQHPLTPPPASVSHEGGAWGRGYQIFELTSSYTCTTSKLVPVLRIMGGGGGGKSIHEVVLKGGLERDRER
jgi:hypothetical protein